MSTFTDIENVLQTPFIVKTTKIGMTIGNGIGSVVNLLITMLLIILYTVAMEGGCVVFYLWDRTMTHFNCKTIIKYNHDPQIILNSQGHRYTIFSMFPTALPMFPTASPMFSIYLENILDSGKDNHYVTNGWNSYILVLFGKYTEHMVITDASNAVQEIENDQLTRGCCRYQPKNVYHKISLEKNTNAWVLRLAFKKQHEPRCVEISDNKIKTL